jgi:hypothetical protein
MMGYYILDDNHNVVAVDLMTWARWYETDERLVGDTTVGDVRVSTVFLGIDHNFGSSHRPILFETLIFGGEFDQEMERYSTWDEAEIGHAEMVSRVGGER